MFVLINKHLPDRDGKTTYSSSHKTHETREDADAAAYHPIRNNYPFRSKVVEIANPWEAE